MIEEFVTLIIHVFGKQTARNKSFVAVLQEHSCQLTHSEVVVRFHMMTAHATSGAEVVQFFAHED